MSIQRSWILFFAFALVLLVSIVTAAEKTEKAKKATIRESTVNSSAALRLWKDAFPSKRGIRVQIRPARRGAAVEIPIASDTYRFMDYFELPAGDAVVEIVDDANAKVSLSGKSVTLLPKSFTTLLLREKGDTFTAEFIDDTVAESAQEIGELCVRNFAPTLTKLQIQAGDAVNVQLNSSSSFLHVRGLTKMLFQVECSGMDESGKTLKWTNEVDFRIVRKATLLFYPDPYGRIRPSLVIDGEMRNSALEKESGQN